jgi:hypothetical protein
MNDEREGMRQEAVVANFRVLSYNWNGVNEETLSRKKFSDMKADSRQV